MPIERFYDPHLEITSSGGQLTDEEMHHAVRVFRLKEGQACQIINGHGLLAEASIEEITKKHVSYKVHSIHKEPKKALKRSLVLGMPKFNRLEFIIEKVCELGCDHIVLFNADRSEKTDLSKNQLERLQFLLQAALKQCGRLYFPALEFRPHLEACLESDVSYYFGDVHATQKLPRSLEEKVGFVIGPESGFSEKENLFLSTKATGISLSDAVLRVDTAAICAVSLISYF